MIEDSHEHVHQFQMITLLAISKVKKHFGNELMNISVQIWRGHAKESESHQEPLILVSTTCE